MKLKKNKTVAIIGLGYVGLPLAVEFSKKFDVIGFDTNNKRILELISLKDVTNEVEINDLRSVISLKKTKGTIGLKLTSSLNDLTSCNTYIITVPTPINRFKTPNLSPLLKASKQIGKILCRGDVVIYESTVYPGCTEEDCIPVLEKGSGLKFQDDFKVGYSPERINPGDKVHTLQNVIKVSSGCCAESSEEIAKTYELVVGAGVHRAPNIKVAEAAKIIENTQRDVNIALINELSIIFNKLNINTFDVLEAAGTKWNFLKFSPGLVGGHCIGVDPYYLTHKAQQSGYHAKVITSGRSVNDSMGFYIAKQTVKKILAQGKHIQDAKVLVMGATFKEDVSDIRNSKIIDIVNELKSFQVKVDLVDPHASSNEMEHEYGIPLSATIGQDYDAVIVAVNHAEYLKLEESYFQSLLKDKNGVFVDVKGIYKDQMNELEYWSL